jgi:hypothetical protein
MKAGKRFICCLLMTVCTAHGWAVSPQFLADNGERLEGLFEALDPGHPGIRPIRDSWNSGQHSEAATALATYFEDKRVPKAILQPLLVPANQSGQAEAALEDRFYLLGKWCTIPTTEDGSLDWEYRGPGDDKELAWMLNRHDALPVLARAWEESGDPSYRAKANSLWRDWISSNPYPSRLTFSAQWRALEVARRINNSWLHVARIPGLLDTETRLLVLSSILDHADALKNHSSFWGGNHLITEKLALLTLAVACPEFTAAKEWQGHAIGKIDDQIMKQSYPDGSYKELSNHYQRVVLLNAQHFLQLLSKVQPDYRESEIYQRITAMWDFFAGVMKPDGTGPINNASDRELNALHIEAAWQFHNRLDWLAMATHGVKGQLPPGSPSKLYPWAGQAILRSDWGPRADWIYFDAGPYGTAHQHVDRFHISASINGRQVLTDSGRYTYQPGPWRTYFKGPASHSVILLDGSPAQQGPRKVSSPMPVLFQETEAVVVTGARSQFTFDHAVPGLNAPVPWVRVVAYDKQGFALIFDHLVTFKNHTIESRWHFHPTISEEEANGYLTLAHPSGVLEQTLQRGSTASPPGGFHSVDYDRKEAAILLRQSGNINRPTTMAWVLQSPDEAVVNIQILSKAGAPVIHFRTIRGTRPHSEGRVSLYPEPRLLEYRLLLPDGP